MMHNICKYCGGRFGGEEELNVCFACFELYEEEGGPQYDPEEHPPEELKKEQNICNYSYFDDGM